MVSDLVVAEAYFALHAHYEVPKREAVRVLRQFLESEFVLQETDGCAREALRAMEGSSAKPGFVDRLIHAQYLRKCGGMVTFEKAGAKLPRATVL